MQPLERSPGGLQTRPLAPASPRPDSQGNIVSPTAANTGATIYPKESRRKYIQSWNLTVEGELLWKFTGQAGYVGTRAVGQMGFININAAAPDTGSAGSSTREALPG